MLKSDFDWVDINLRNVYTIATESQSMLSKMASTKSKLSIKQNRDMMTQLNKEVVTERWT